MNLVKAVVLGSVAVLFTSGCSIDTVSSKEVSPNAIHQSYSLDYEEASDTTRMFAQLRVGGGTGTTVDVSDRNDLKINGQVPSKSSFLGTSYSISGRGFVRQATFEYRAEDGRQLVNSISIDPLYLRRADQALAVSQPYVIEMEAPRLGSGEYVSVRLTQKAQRSDGTTEYLSAEGMYIAATQKASFVTSELNKLANGMATLEISRRKSQSLAQSMRDGGGMSATYTLRSLAVQVSGKPSSVMLNPLAKN